MDDAKFTVGVIEALWSGEHWELRGRKVYTAQLTHLGGFDSMRSDLVRAALMHVVVRAPDNTLVRIVGVEAFAVMSLTLGGTGRIGLMVEPTGPGWSP